MLFQTVFRKERYDSEKESYLKYMEIKKADIDGGKAFDWGRTSGDYAKFRDIYPAAFYDAVLRRGFCTAGQKCLDLGTGTGVLPRNLYHAGAGWCGTDISPEQIAQAKQLASAAGMQIDFRTASAETTDYPDESFDTVTACQCYWYFDPEKAYRNIARMLKPGGSLVLLYMGWLSEEDRIAAASEEIVLKYNPGWTGAGDRRHLIAPPAQAEQYFETAEQTMFDLPVHFTRENWHGRMRACRGVGASLEPAQLKAWDAEHMQMLMQNAPVEFDILHYAAMTVLQKRNV